jgi:hypothetical protein
LTEPGVLRAQQGKLLTAEHFQGPAPATDAVFAWYTVDEHLVALGRQSDPGEFRVVRGMSNTR